MVISSQELSIIRIGQLQQPPKQNQSLEFFHDSLIWADPTRMFSCLAELAAAAAVNTQRCSSPPGYQDCLGTMKSMQADLRHGGQGTVDVLTGPLAPPPVPFLASSSDLVTCFWLTFFPTSDHRGSIRDLASNSLFMRDAYHQLLTSLPSNLPLESAPSSPPPWPPLHAPTPHPIISGLGQLVSLPLLLPLQSVLQKSFSS